jgi:hypothetical protein
MIRRLAAWVATAAVVAMVAAVPVFAADIDPFDPQGAGAILGSVLTLAGGTVASVIVAAFIQYALKPLGAAGVWVDAHEQIVTLFLGAALILYAAAATGYVLTAISGFGLLIAWLGFAKLTGAAYDTAKSVKTAITSAS